MKKTIILLSLLFFSFVSVAEHEKIKHPTFYNYDSHVPTGSLLLHLSNLDLARKNYFHAQGELVIAHLSQSGYTVSYPEAVYWYMRVLEHDQCGWDWIGTGVDLLLKQRPKNHNMSEKSLNTTLYALLTLEYEFFVAYEYYSEYSDEREHQLNTQLLELKSKLNKFDIERANNYVRYLKSKWKDSWGWKNSWATYDTSLELYNSDQWSCYWDEIEKYEKELIKIYKKHL